MAGNYASDLFATLNAQMPTHEWEEDILRAFQAWAVQSNINIGLVADGGEPFGTLGLKQSDPRFGDVRIGAFPMGADLLADANPYNPFVASTLVGDVFLNSDYVFSDNGANSTYDLFSVALHEAGHVYGFPDNLDPNSAMYESYHADSSLSATDVADLQALYGPRKADPLDGTLATATPLKFAGWGDEATSITAVGDIGSLTDVDTYRLVAPQGSPSLTVSIDVAGYSLLTPRVTLLDASGAVLSTAVTTDPLNNNLSISLDQVKPGATYYVQVSSGQSNVFGLGGYELQVESHGPEPVAPGSAGPVEANPSPPTNGTPFLADHEYMVPASGYAENSYSEQNGIDILATTPGYVEHTYYELVDTVSPAWASQTYEVQSADIGPGLTNVMTVVLNYSDNPDVKFDVTIRDDQGKLVAAKTLDDSAGYLELQVMPIGSAQNYFVKVQSYNPPANGATFDLRVDYSLNGNDLETYVSDSLSRGQYSAARTLQVIQSQEFDFVLAATDWSVPTPTGVRMEIADQDGQIVDTMSVADGAQRFGDVFLDQGQYTVTFTRATEGVDTPVAFTLSALTTSDRLGPQLRDTIQEPLDSPADSTVPQLTFYWLPNDLNLAAAGEVNRALQPPGEVRDSTGTQTAEILSRETATDRDKPIASLQVGQQTQQDRVAQAIVVRPFLRQFAATHNWFFAAYSLSQRTASEEPVRPYKERPIPGLGEMLWSPHVKSKLDNDAPAAVDERLSDASEGQPSDDGQVPYPIAVNGGNTRLIDRVLAWIQSLDAGDYAAWTIPPVCLALGWYALKRLPMVRRGEHAVAARLARRNRLAVHRRRANSTEMSGAP
jgi:hypothetical protein